MLERLGAYRLLRQIGEGALGAVFEAERDDGQFHQKVAIKILRAGVSEPHRFEAERRTLAQLQHPYIASLIDGGTVDGLPYIVMELINGLPIDEHVREQHLNLKERLELFLLVCRGVEHAHAALVVHRDIKPQNILVTNAGIPKLLDFSMARRHGSQATMVMPQANAYTSPEQNSGGVITTASDVYSLGVLLGELVDGMTNGDDLTNVIAMATRLEPQRRYGSVGQFAEDIERYLEGRMVIARPDTIRYRWSKFALRNRIPLVLTGGLVLVLLLSVGLVYREGLRAQRRFDEVHTLLTSMTNEMDAEAAPLVGSAKLRRMMIEKALNYLNRLVTETGEDERLLTELARAYHQVGDIQGHRRYQNLGRYNEALDSHLKGLGIEEKLVADGLDDAKLKSQMAWGYAHAAELYSMRGDGERAVTFAMKARSLANPSDLDTYVDAQIGISRVLHFEDRLEEALQLLQQTMDTTGNKITATRRAALLKWAGEEAHYLGLVPLTLRFNSEAIELLEKTPLERNDRSRLNVARRDRGVALSQAYTPNEERHCEAIADLQFAVDGQTEIYRQDRKSINRMIQVTTALQMLSASQALCHDKNAIVTAEEAFRVFNEDKPRQNPDLEFHLAFAHIELGQWQEAAKVIARVAQPTEELQELQARILLHSGKAAEARALLAKAREKRKRATQSRDFQRRVYCYQQAVNIRMAIEAGDTTPGLREEGLKWLSVFPETGVARSILRLREDLRK